MVKYKRFWWKPQYTGAKAIWIFGTDILILLLNISKDILTMKTNLYKIGKNCFKFKILGEKL